MSARCPSCNSGHPERFPAAQFEGEVSNCHDRFHDGHRLPDWERATQAKRGNHADGIPDVMRMLAHFYAAEDAEAAR